MSRYTSSVNTEDVTRRMVFLDIDGVLAPIRFDVIGGDARLDGLRIEVVPNPTLEMELEAIHLFDASTEQRLTSQ